MHGEIAHRLFTFILVLVSEVFQQRHLQILAATGKGPGPAAMYLLPEEWKRR